jgi:hypothetical protein
MTNFEYGFIDAPPSACIKPESGWPPSKVGVDSNNKFASSMTENRLLTVDAKPKTKWPTQLKLTKRPCTERRSALRWRTFPIYHLIRYAAHHYLFLIDPSSFRIAGRVLMTESLSVLLLVSLWTSCISRRQKTPDSPLPTCSISCFQFSVFTCTTDTTVPSTRRLRLSLATRMLSALVSWSY